MSSDLSMNTELTFEELIAPMTPREFFDHYWDQKDLHIARNDPAYYRSLFEIADIDRCIYSARHTTQDNLTIIPPPDSDRKMQRHMPGSVSMDKVYNAFHGGDTIRLMALQGTWPPIANLAANLAAAFSSKININFYLTPAESQGFPIHVDTHDVFVLQCEGSKNWYVYEPLYELPTYTLGSNLDDMKAKVQSPLEEDEVVLRQKVELKTGDMLFIPRGFPHKAVTAGEPSLHLTAGIHVKSWVDLAKAAVERLCLEHRELRCSLPPGFATDAAIAAELPKTMREIFDRTLGDLAIEPCVESFVKSTITSRAFPADGHLARLLTLDQLRADTWVERRPGLACAVETSEEGATIEFASNSVSGPAGIGEALEFVAAQKRFQIADLPGPLGESSKLVLARRLVREGLLRPVADHRADRPSVHADAEARVAV